MVHSHRMIRIYVHLLHYLEILCVIVVGSFILLLLEVLFLLFFFLPLLRRLLSSQYCPVKPFAHLHLLPFRHFPPLRQDGEHRAARLITYLHEFMILCTFAVS